MPPDSLEGKEAADWLAKKAKSVFVVDDLTDYGKGAADAVEAELKAKGISATRQGVAQKTTDYSVIAQKVKASGAGALFYGGYDTQAALFAKGLKTAGYTGITMAGNGGKSSKFTGGRRRGRRRLVLLLRLPGRHRRPAGEGLQRRLHQDVEHPAVDLLPGGVRRDQRDADGDQGRRELRHADAPVRVGRSQQGGLQGHNDRGQVPAER